MKSHKNTKKNTKKINKKNTKNTKKNINKNTKKIKGGSSVKSTKKGIASIISSANKKLRREKAQETYIRQGHSRNQSTMYTTPGEYSELNHVVYEEIPGSTANSGYEIVDGYYETVKEPIYQTINNSLLYSNPQNSIGKNSGVYNNPQTRRGQEYITIGPLYNMASSSTNGPLYSLASGNQLSQESNNDPYAETRKVLKRTNKYNTPQFVNRGSMNNPTYNFETMPPQK